MHKIRYTNMVQDFEKRFPLAYKYQNSSFDWANIFNPQAGYDELMDLLNSNSFEHDVDYLKSNWERIGRLLYDKMIEGYENELLRDSLTHEQRIKIQYAVNELRKEKERRYRSRKQITAIGSILISLLLLRAFTKKKDDEKEQ